MLTILIILYSIFSTQMISSTVGDEQQTLQSDAVIQKMQSNFEKMYKTYEALSSSMDRDPIPINMSQTSYIPLPLTIPRDFAYVVKQKLQNYDFAFGLAVDMGDIGLVKYCEYRQVDRSFERDICLYLLNIILMVPGDIDLLKRLAKDQKSDENTAVINSLIEYAEMLIQQQPTKQ